jgi:hypothetical protein
MQLYHTLEATFLCCGVNMMNTNIPAHTQSALYWAVYMYRTEGATRAIQFCDISEIMVAAFLVYAALCK